MAIRLLLKNNNINPVDLKVYRSDTEIKPDALPTPLMTMNQVTGDPIIVNDTTAVQDQFYHYMFHIIGAKDSQLSRDFYLQATETRGEGKSKILIGDVNLGYMDNILSDALIGPADLIAAFGITTGTINTGMTTWYKFVRNNKVLYVPNQHISYGITYTALLNAGLLDGSKTVTIKGNTYKVRVPKGWDDSASPQPYPADSSSIDQDTLTVVNEFNDLMYPFLDYTPNGQRLPNMLQQAYTVHRVASYPVICQERNTAGTQAMHRGQNSNSRQAFTQARSLSVNTSGVWWPILELVES